MKRSSIDRSKGADALVWGPSLWTLLFTIVFKTHDTTQVRRILEELQHVIPCRVCRKSYTSFLMLHPLPVNDQCESLCKWLWQCKDMVNQKLGQPYRSYPDVKKRYQVFHTHTSIFAILDLCVIMSANVSDNAARHLMVFAQTVGTALEPILGPGVLVLKSLPTSTEIVASEARRAIHEAHASYCASVSVSSAAEHHLSVVD